MKLIEIEELLNENLYDVTKDDYNHEYDSYTFKIKDGSFRHRSAKITPKKVGGFVVMWEKDNQEVNTPFNYDDFPDYLIVNVVDNEYSGYFIFSKGVLKDKGILSFENKKGKMGFRVYPPWVSNLNATASKSKEWQIEYFNQI